MNMVRTPTAAFVLVILCLTTSLVVAQNPKAPTLTDSFDCHADYCLFLVYDPKSGNLSFKTASARGDDTVWGLEIESQAGLFIPGPDSDGDGFGDNCLNLGGDFDVCSSTRFAKVSREAYHSLSLGNILPIDLTGEALVADLVVDPGFDPVPWSLVEVYLYVVPEPSAVLLSSLCIVVLLLLRRRR